MARRMKYDVEAKEEGKEGEGGFLSRWSDRKNQIEKAEMCQMRGHRRKSLKIPSLKMKKMQR